MVAFLAPLAGLGARLAAKPALTAAAGFLGTQAPRAWNAISGLGGGSHLPAYLSDTFGGGGGGGQPDHTFDPRQGGQQAPPQPQQQEPVTLASLGIGTPSYVDPGAGLIDPGAIQAAYQANPDVLARYDEAVGQIGQRGAAGQAEIERQFGFGQDQVGTLPAAYARTYEDYVMPQQQAAADAVQQSMAQRGIKFQGTGGLEALQAATAANQASRESLTPMLQAGLGERSAAQQGRLAEVLAGLEQQVEAGRTGYLENLSTGQASALANAAGTNAQLAQQAAQFNAGQDARFDEMAAGLAQQQDTGPSYSSLVQDYQPTKGEISAAAGASLSDDTALRDAISGNPNTVEAYNEARQVFAQAAANPAQFPEAIQNLQRKYPNYTRTLSLAIYDSGIRPSLEELAGLGG